MAAVVFTMFVVGKVQSQTQDFSGNYEEFVDQMSTLMKVVSDRQRSKEFMEQLEEFMLETPEVDPMYKDQIISTYNDIRKKKARPFPDYHNVFTTIKKIAETNKIIDKNYLVWSEVLSEKVKSRTVNLRFVNRYLTATQAFLEDYTLSKTPSVRWKIDPCPIVFLKDEEGLKIDVPITRVICLAQQDSIEIFETSGRYDFETSRWVGNEGVVTWERCGLDRSSTIATFGKYNVDMTKNQFNVDSVCFKNMRYFDFPLYGMLEHKVTKIKSEDGTKYPKFTTTTERYEIKQIFENVDYSGGFSQVGASMHGSSSEGVPAELSIYRNDTLFVTARSHSFRLLPDRVDGLSVAIAITLDDKQITHPGLRFRYLDDKKEMHLVRGGDGLEQSVYFDYYHMVTLDVEFVRWKVGSTEIELKMVDGAAKGYANFSSMDFFRKQYYRELQYMNWEHPFQLIYDFYRVNGGQPFSTIDYVAYCKQPETQIRQEFIRLSFQGFINYDEVNDMVEPTDKLLNYLDYNSGKKDYDVIRFGSVTEGKVPNGVLDLKNYDIQLNGVYEIQLGEDPNEMSYEKRKQSVAILPKDHKVILKRNRDFKFDGSVTAGLISLRGRGFYFSYDDYRIELNEIEEMMMMVRTGRYDSNGMPVVEAVNNTISDLSGFLEIDEPDNKSWKKVNPQYPRLTSTKDSYVYYDHPSIQQGKYTRDKFYYKVDPFVLENLKEIETDKTSFEGELSSGMIFPPIRQPLVVRKHDNSLGFEKMTPEEGLPAYNGRATFYNEVDLSNKGLRGTGEFRYVKSRSKSEDMLFLPEEAYCYTYDFYVEKTTEGVQFPDVELGKNQEVTDNYGEKTSGETFLEFMAFEDRMAVSNTKGEFHMFKNPKSVLGYDCIHRGTLYVSPSGLTGYGVSDLPRGAKLESAMMDFTDHTIVADTSYFAQYRPNPNIPGTMLLQSDGLRHDILVGDTTIRENRNRKSFYGITAGKHPEKRYCNSALRDDAIYKDMMSQDNSIKDLFFNKSMVATIDFDKREGYFTYKNSFGGEKVYSSIEYKTWVKQFTWDMDRNVQVVGHKGSSPGLRFVCTKEKRDSLQFYVPYARFLGDEDVMYCEEVKHINTADAKVILDERGLVTLHTHGVMDPLEQSKVELRTDSTYHLLYDTKITIEGAKKYKGFGYYDFVNKKGETFPVFMSEIGTDKDAVSVTKGSVGEEITFDDYFAYKGEMRIRNGRQLLEYNGGARMIHNAAKGPTGYVRFNSVIDPQKVLIPIGDKITNWPNDEIHRNFFMRKDSCHVYSSFIESRKDHSDIEMIQAEGYLYHNDIFDRFDITTAEKMAVVDTVGTIMSFIPSENAMTGFGLIDLGVMLPAGNPLEFVTAGDLRDDRMTNTITLNTLMRLDFFLDRGLVTQLYDMITMSDAPKCDSMYSSFECRMREYADTALYNFIMRERSLPLEEVVLKKGEEPRKMLPDYGSIFTLDNVALLWNTPKKAYICDTTVNLMLMRDKSVNKKVRLQSEFVVRKSGSWVDMVITADADTWIYIGYKNGNVQITTSNKDFNDALQKIDPKERRDKSRGSIYTFAPDSRRKRFLANFGVKKVSDVPSEEAEDQNDEAEGGEEGLVETE
jgi:hypothetical protein